MSDTRLDLPAVQKTDPAACFSAWLEQRGASAKTIAAYRGDMLRYAAWFQAVNRQPFSLDLLTSVDLRAYRVHSLDQERVTPATWNRRRAAMALLCRYARETGEISYDPLAGVAPAEAVDLPPRWLERGEQNRLLRQCERNLNAARTPAAMLYAARDQAMILLMLHAGLREAELVTLDIPDLVITQRGGRVVVRNGKGGKRREIPLSAETRRAAQYWLNLHAAAGHSGEPLFFGKGSSRLTTRQVQRIVGGIGRQAGIAVTPHQLRHSFAKRLVDDGRPLNLVQRLLGHARLDTTARYTQPGWEDYERAVANL